MNECDGCRRPVIFLHEVCLLILDAKNCVGTGLISAAAVKKDQRCKPATSDASMMAFCYASKTTIAWQLWLTWS